MTMRPDSVAFTMSDTDTLAGSSVGLAIQFRNQPEPWKV